AGAWRACLPGAAALPACVVHERRKYLCRDDRGRRYALRYAGLGAWGDAVAERARRLAEAGLGPPPLGSADGFLALPWLEGRPAGPADARDRAFLRALAEYLAARTAVLRTGAAARTEPILEMLETNAREALGGRDGGLSAAVRRLERLPEREAIIPDARLHLPEWVAGPHGYVKTAALDHGDGVRAPGAPGGGLSAAVRRLGRLPEREASIPDARPDLHEWVAGAHGYVKTDALDRGDGVRLPGPADPAWALAGAVVELGLDASAAAE